MHGPIPRCRACDVVRNDARCQIRVTACRGPKITPHRQHCPWQRGSCGDNGPINTGARGTYSWTLGTPNMQLPGSNGSECVPINQPAHLARLGCRHSRPASKRGSLAIPSSSAGGRHFARNTSPSCNCTGLRSVMPHRSIAQALRDACRTRGERSYCSHNHLRGGADYHHCDKPSTFLDHLPLFPNWPDPTDGGLTSPETPGRM